MLFRSATLVVKSPGIPEKAAIVGALREKGIELVSEIEFASWFTRGEIIAITGTNGKTTTTLLTYHLLRTAGLDAALGGNVGKSFAANVAERESSIHVLELSSFQLDDIRRFRPRIAGAGIAAGAAPSTRSASRRFGAHAYPISRARAQHRREQAHELRVRACVRACVLSSHPPPSSRP